LLGVSRIITQNLDNLQRLVCRVRNLDGRRDELAKKNTVSCCCALTQ